MYCIYSGKEIDAQDTNIEHIIPLSLGGSNDFTINVSEKLNSYLGSKIDGKLTQDFLVNMDRVHYAGKGHSKKEAKLNIRSELEDGSPVITTFTQKEMKVFDPVNKQYIKTPDKVKMMTKLDLDLRIKFTAKVILATGYFLFGDIFVNHADCKSLRNIMMSDDLRKTIKTPGLVGKIRFFDPLRTGKECAQDPEFQVYKLFVESGSDSSVVWSYAPDRCIVCVAIYGKFVGMINFSADVDVFPKTDDFWLGHALICRDGKLIRMSWRDAILEMCEKNKLLDAETLERARKFKG